MTREELKEHCQRQIQQFERVEKIMPVTPNDWKRYEEHKLILELLEQTDGDLISRQATVERLCKVAEFMNEKRDGLGSPYVMAALFIQDNKDEFPSVTPQPSAEKTAEWIYRGNSIICSSCGEKIPYGIHNYYCRNCGAKMKGLEE